MAAYCRQAARGNSPGKGLRWSWIHILKEKSSVAIRAMRSETEKNTMYKQEWGTKATSREKHATLGNCDTLLCNDGSIVNEKSFCKQNTVTGGGKFQKGIYLTKPFEPGGLCLESSQVRTAARQPHATLRLGTALTAAAGFTGNTTEPRRGAEPFPRTALTELLRSRRPSGPTYRSGPSPAVPRAQRCAPPPQGESRKPRTQPSPGAGSARSCRSSPARRRDSASARHHRCQPFGSGPATTRESHSNAQRKRRGRSDLTRLEKERGGSRRAATPLLGEGLRREAAVAMVSLAGATWGLPLPRGRAAPHAPLRIPVRISASLPIQVPAAERVRRNGRSLLSGCRLRGGTGERAPPAGAEEPLPTPG